jgi:hypothetical protein
MAQEQRSAANIAHYLRGIDFPCTRDQLVDHCRLGNCPTEVTNVLEGLPNRQFNSMADVMSGLGQVE